MAHHAQATKCSARMDLAALKQAHADSTAMAALTVDQVRQVRLRYEAFFGQTRGALNGQWAWEDTTAAYLLLDSLALKEEASGLARFLFEDFSHYFTARKPVEQFCMLIVDEFSALASGSGMAERVEQARGFNTSLVLAPQVVAGMGDEQQADRILGSVETVICHRVNTPERIIGLAGTRQRPEYSTRYGAEGSSGEGSARSQHQFKIDPNQVRGLAPGLVFVISQGKAMKAKIFQAPNLRAELPTPAEPPAPTAPPVPAVPVKAVIVGKGAGLAFLSPHNLKSRRTQQMRNQKILPLHSTLMYLGTFALEVPVILTRVMLALFTAAIALAITGHDVHHANTWAQLAFLPSACSLLALITPIGTGWWWKQSIGGRQPSEREQYAYQQAIQLLQDSTSEPLLEPKAGLCSTRRRWTPRSAATRSCSPRPPRKRPPPSSTSRMSSGTSQAPTASSQQPSTG